MIKTWSQYKYYVKADLFRITGEITWRCFIKTLRYDCGFRYCFWMRTCNYLATVRRIRFFLLPFARYFHSQYTFKYGISIPYTTHIGYGFYIGHFGGIVINKNCVIGNNCNISQGVTLGQTNRGAKKGTPVIGDRVYIGPGAVVIGNIKVGNNVAIGANCVVTKDVPDNGVVVGIPRKVISYLGSVDYINRTEYDPQIMTTD